MEMDISRPRKTQDFPEHNLEAKLLLADYELENEK